MNYEIDGYVFTFTYDPATGRFILLIPMLSMDGYTPFFLSGQIPQSPDDVVTWVGNVLKILGVTLPPLAKTGAKAA